MKIIIIHHFGNMGGGTLSCFDIVEALKQNHHNVIVSLPTGKNAARLMAHKKKIRILDVAAKPVVFAYYNGGSSLLKVILKAICSLCYIRRWINILKCEKPDIVLLNSIVQWPMILLLNYLKIKNICFVRETMRGRAKGFINRMIAYSLHQSSGVSFLSQYDKDQWSLKPSVCQTISPDTVDIKAFSEGIDKESSRNKLKLDSDVFYILYAGGMNELKGARTIIQAIMHCPCKNIELLFLGDLGTNLMNLHNIKRMVKTSQISFIKEMNRYIEKNDLQDRIHLFGIQTKMNDWYAACDVVVFPAIIAHQARPIYEAGVFKKPIIASDFSNYREYLKPNVSGLVFEPGNCKALAKMIKRLYAEVPFRIEIGNNNFSMAEKYHNAMHVNRNINNFIDEVGLL